MTLKHCKDCRKVFDGDNRRTCCNDCRNKTCVMCGNKTGGRANTCSKRCYLLANRKRTKALDGIPVCCMFCGSVEILAGHARKEYESIGKCFCDRTCRAGWTSFNLDRSNFADVLAKNKARNEHARTTTKLRKEMERIQSIKHSCCGWCGRHMVVREGKKYCDKCSVERAAGRQRIRNYWARPASRECLCCGDVFGRERPSGVAYCSERCSKRASKAARRRRIKTGDCDSVGTAYVAKLFNYVCCECGILCDKTSSKNADSEATIDHIIPVSKGGLHVLENMQLLCRRCNYLKGNTMPTTHAGG